MTDEKLPALTDKEARRLWAIAQCDSRPDWANLSPNCQKTSTDNLIRLGYVVVRGRKVSSSGRVQRAGECAVTSNGYMWLERHGKRIRQGK